MHYKTTEYSSWPGIIPINWSALNCDDTIYLSSRQIAADRPSHTMLYQVYYCPDDRAALYIQDNVDAKHQIGHQISFSFQMVLMIRDVTLPYKAL